MRFKATPLAARSPSSRPARRSEQRRDPSRLRDWLSTLPILLLIPALVLPVVFVLASSSGLETARPADDPPTDSPKHASKKPVSGGVQPQRDSRPRVSDGRPRPLSDRTLPAGHRGGIATRVATKESEPNAAPAEPSAAPPSAAPPSAAPPSASPSSQNPTPAPSVAPAPAAGDLQALVNAAPPGGTVNYSGSWSGTLTIAKPLTLIGGRINGSVEITASNVSLRSMAVIGPQSATWSSGQNAIYAEAVSNVTLDGVEAGNVGNAGIRFHYVTGFTIVGAYVHDAVYAGIITTSSTDGLIAGGTVERIGMNGSSAANSNNAYGVALTRFGFDAGTPKAARITVRNMTVRDVPTWHGLDTHGGVDIVFEGNRIERTYRGIMITAAGGQRVTARNNSIIAASYIGIAVVDTKPYTVTGNAISASPNIGIFVEGSACGTLSGNSIAGSATQVLDEGGRC
jgi:hypothetical protein